MLCCLLFPLLLLSAASCNKKNTRGKIRSVLILGNSIVKHGAAPQIGWQGDWVWQLQHAIVILFIY